MNIKLPMYLFFIWSLELMILMGLNSLLGPFEGLDFLGLNGTPFAHCHFRAQKSLDFQGPPLPKIKSITTRAIQFKQQLH
jgi:hypothetical protein